MTKLEWNLQEIFNNNKAFYNEIDNVKKLLKDILQYENIKLDPNLLLDMLNKKWKIKELSNNILLYGSLMYYKNINNDECIKLKEEAEKFNNKVNTILTFVDRKIIDLGLKKVNNYIIENPKLEIYKLSLYNLFRLEEHIQSKETNKKIQVNNNIINEQLNMYNRLLKDINYGYISIDDKEVKITSSNLVEYISSNIKDIDVRIDI